MKRLLSILLMVALLIGMVSMISGCNSTQTDSGDRPTLKLYIINGNYHEGASKDSVWKYIEDQCNVTIEISGMVNSDDYYTTLSPRLNSARDMPDIFFAEPGSTGGAYYTWADQAKGILYDWTNLLAGQEDKYPYLNSLLTAEQYKNVTYDGAHTLLVNGGYPNSGWGIYYRADWLVKIGYYTENADGTKTARVPVNMDEFEDVMKKFSDPTYDLNGDGSKTYGLSPFAGEWANQPLYHAFGVSTDYDINEKGEVEYMCLTQEYKNFLTWFNKCYNNGWVDPQFYTNTPGGGGDSDAFEEGRTGILITNAGNHVIWNAKPMEDIWGKGTCVMGPPPVGTKNIGVEGAGGWSNWGGMWGGFSITQNCADVDAALRLFNYLLSPEGSMTKTYGIEGKHWKWNEDKTAVVPILENREIEPEGAFASATNVDGETGLYGEYRFGSILGTPPVDWELYEETGEFQIFTDWSAIDPSYAHLMAQAAQYNTMLATSKLVNYSGLSQALSKKTTAIHDLCNIYAIQAMVGQKNLDADWDALIAECKGEGLEAIYDAYEAFARSEGLID